MGFYLVPYCQPSPPTRFLLITAIGMCLFLRVHHFGMECLAGSKVNIQHSLRDWEWFRYVVWHSWWISKMQSDILEERYAIKLCFKLGKNATETYGMLQTAFRPSCMNRVSVFEWHKRFKQGMESVRDNESCGRSKQVNTLKLIGQRVRVRVTMLKFRKRFRRKKPALFKSAQWHFY